MIDRAYEIAINSKYEGCQRGLASVVYNFFDKKTVLRTGASVNEELSQDLYKPVVKKFNERKVYANYKNNIWAADLAKMGFLSSKNCGVKYLSCVIDVFTKYGWIKPLKVRKARHVLHGFIEIVKESK